MNTPSWMAARPLTSAGLEQARRIAAAEMALADDYADAGFHFRSAIYQAKLDRLNVRNAAESKHRRDISDAMLDCMAAELPAADPRGPRCKLLGCGGHDCDCTAPCPDPRCQAIDPDDPPTR